MAHYRGDLASAQYYADPMVTTALTEHIAAASFQYDNPCQKFQRNFFKCMSAFGMPAGREFCDFEYRDWMECNDVKKQNMRAEAIRKERERQFLSGERERVWERGFPKLADTFGDWHSNNPSAM